MLQPHDNVPHFAVTDIDGGAVTYGSIWQHSHLVLVCLGHALAADEGERERLKAYARSIRQLAGADVACVITRDEIPSVPCPGAIVADRWGEIAYVAPADDVHRLPSPDALAEWIEYLRSQCPECEGEAR
jgi:hypothetical protein